MLQPRQNATNCISSCRFDCFDLNLIKRLCTNQRVSSYLVAIGRGNVLINVVGKLQL